jgi:hypothetical protein
MRKGVTFNGISSSTVYEEGDCYSLVNLRKKNGALTPVAPRKEVQELTMLHTIGNYDVTFEHIGSGYDNHIGINNLTAKGKFQVWWKTDTTPEFLGRLTGTATSIWSNGEAVVIETDVMTYYMVWMPGGYYEFHNGVVPDMTIDQYSYDIVFVHRYANDYENWIGVINYSGGNSQVFWNIKDATPTLIADLPENVNDMEQTGHVLAFYTDSNAYYAIFRDGAYTYLGTVPEMPSVGIDIPSALGSYLIRFDQMYEFNQVSAGWRYFDITPDNFVERIQALIAAGKIWIQEGYTDTSETKDTLPSDITGITACLFDAHVVRLGFILYDGSVVMHTPPFLAMPNFDIKGSCNAFYAFQKMNTGGINKESDAGQDEGIWLRDWGDPNSQGAQKGVGGIEITPWRLRFKYDFTNANVPGIENWRGIIRSIGIYMSPPIGATNTEKINGAFNYNNVQEISGSRYMQYTPVWDTIPFEAVEAVRSGGNFYLVKEIPFNGDGNDKNLSGLIFPVTEEDRYSMENIIYKERMPLDAFTHNYFGAKGSYAYNRRNHTFGIKETLFRGFSEPYFRAYDNYNGVSTNSDPSADVTQAMETAMFSSLPLCFAEVEIQIGLGIEKVYSDVTDMSTWQRIFLNAFLSYPDPRARRITWYTTDNTTAGASGNWRKLYSIELKEHSALNLAYYLNDEMKPIRTNLANEWSNGRVDITVPVSVFEGNRLRVSETNNPFYVPLLNEFHIGLREILNVAANVMNVSDRNYGAYPLFVFCTDGIWTLTQGNTADVVYATIASPTSNEVPISKVVCETPYGVVFISERGLFMINSNNLTFLSPQIEERYPDMTIDTSVAEIAAVVPAWPPESYTEFMKGIREAAYHARESELHLYGLSENYALVYNFAAQMFYLSTDADDIVVRNLYPALMTIRNNILKDYADENTPNTFITLFTRPLRYVAGDVKRLDRMMLRSLLFNVTDTTAGDAFVSTIYHAYDGLSFTLTRGRKIPEGSYKDIDMSLMGAGKFNYYMYAIAGYVDAKSRIQLLEAEVQKEYRNEKMR